MNELNHKQTILFGIGNNGRQDDGLGWAFLEMVEKDGRFRGEILYRYQLLVEDAEKIAQAPAVIFVDACRVELENGFCWENCKPEEHFNHTTHILNPSGLLFLTRELYFARPEAYVLSIQGYEWELEMGLTAHAQENLWSALDFFRKQLAFT